MKVILPEAMFVGFTGTPLMKKDKKKSIEVFGSYIHTYKFDEAVADGVVLDLRYEARDIDQHVTSQKKVDDWFEAKTRGLSNLSKTQLKQKWGTLQKVLSSKSRLQQIVNDILLDMDTKPRLLIVVDKLLTGFDAPSATYLYIDKQMLDHNLFQAICRVNRLDGDDKEYGYIVDYKDLFRSLDKAITDYTQGAFDGYDAEDVGGLLKNRLEQAKQDSDSALEMVRALCEPVKAPCNTQDYIHYFCGESGADQDNIGEKESLRLTLYQSVAKLLRAFGNIANEMSDADYNAQDAESARNQVAYYEKVRDEVKLGSGDLVNMKRFEPAMRHLLDTYIRADDSETLMDFEELGLIELIVGKGTAALETLPEGIRNSPEAMAETIENNVRKTIVDENPVNPKYYEQMSVLLDQLIEQRRQKSIEYQDYLEKIRELSRKVIRPGHTSADYPTSMDTHAKRALYDNFGSDEVLACVHELVHLLERRHNEHFKAYMDKHLPDWRERRNLLNKMPLAHNNWIY